MKKLVVIIMCIAHMNCARQSSGIPAKQTRETRTLQPIFINEQVGSAVTLHCPVRASIAKMYQYLRRIKSGRALDYSRRKMVSLLGLRYRWFKDGKRIRHPRSAWFMKFHEVKLRDTGVYTCKVLMAKQERSRSFFLKVFHKLRYGRPVVESSTKNVSLRVGESATLRCVGKNTRHRPQISWVKLNTPNDENRIRGIQMKHNDMKSNDFLRQGKGFKIVFPKQKTSRTHSSIQTRTRHEKNGDTYVFHLTLDNLKEKNSGVYVCILKNKYGRSYASSSVKVKSSEGAAPYPINEKLRRNFMATPTHNTIRLRCHATGASPLTFQWFKDGKKFKRRLLGEKVNSTTPILRIRNILISDSGVYMCRVSNRYGVYEHKITLKVLQRVPSGPILLDSYPKNVTATLGKTASLQCIELISNPMPDYRWYKWHSVPSTYPLLDFSNSSLFTVISPIHYTPMQVKIGTSSRYGGKLTIKNVTEDDLGLYSCVLRNQFGMDYGSAFLRANKNGPKFDSNVQHLSVIEIPHTGPLKLDCEAKGDPKPLVYWFKNGKRLNQSDGMILSNYWLVLNNLRPQDSGNYTCSVRNIWGLVNRTFDVRIREWLFARPIIVPLQEKSLKLGQRHEVNCTIISEKAITASISRSLGPNHRNQEILTQKARLTKLDRNVYRLSFTIEKPTINDTGLYTCEARNAIGISQRKFKIRVGA